MGQFGAHRPFDQRLCQLLENAVGAGDFLSRLSGQQLI
jgi:hypothetical protein